MLDSEMEDQFGATDAIELDSMEEMFVPKPADNAPPPPDPNSFKLEGDKVPDQFRGKTAAEIVQMASGLQDALKISEQARLQGGNNSPAPVTPAAPAAPVYNRAAIQEMVESGDVIGAMEQMMGYAHAVVTRDMEQRIAPLTGTVSSAAESQARSKYAEEFELFEPEIRAAVAQAGTNMAQPQAWDMVMSYIRGQNIDKIIAHRTAKAQRTAESANLMPSLNDGSRRAAPAGRQGGKPSKQELASDPNVQKILRATGMSLDDYVTWYN